MSNKRNIKFHQECLHNSESFLAEKKEELERTTARLRSEINVLTSQNNFFDKNRFMKSRDRLDMVDCPFCPAQSADCAYGDLRGSQSCEDTRKRFDKTSVTGSATRL